MGSYGTHRPPAGDAEGHARVFAELRNIKAAANLLFDRSLGLEPQDAEAIGYLAQRVDEHVDHALRVLAPDTPS